MHVVCVFLKYVILRALHRMNTKTIALTLVAVAIVAALLVFALSSGGDDDRDDGSDGPGDGDARIPEGCEPIWVPTSIGAVDETGGSFRTVMGSDLSVGDRG